jgi:uncharacterized membrane protein
MFDSSHYHPMVVHFPVALIIVGFLADLTSLFNKREKCLSKTGFYLMVLGAIAALAAWLTGKFFTFEPEQGEIVKIFVKHEAAALVTTLVMITGTLLRIYLVVKKKEETSLKWVVFSFYLLGFISVSITGFLGGTMVFNYMMGI